jgi:hypothetical protein
MNIRVRRSVFFNADCDRQFRWYLERAGERVAVRFLTAVYQIWEKLRAYGIEVPYPQRGTLTGRRWAGFEPRIHKDTKNRPAL